MSSILGQIIENLNMLYRIRIQTSINKSTNPEKRKKKNGHRRISVRPKEPYIHTQFTKSPKNASSFPNPPPPYQSHSHHHQQQKHETKNISPLSKPFTLYKPPTPPLFPPPPGRDLTYKPYPPLSLSSANRNPNGGLFPLRKGRTVNVRFDVV